MTKAMQLLLLALLLSTGACTTAGRIMGLSVAEDVTRITGALTNQETTAAKLADAIAEQRGRLERQEQARIDQDHLLQAASTKLGKLELGVDGQVPPAVYGGGAALLAMLLDLLQGMKRDRDRERREHDETKRQLAEAPRARPRRAAA